MYLYDTEVEILVNGKPVKKYSHDGKTYIQANKGSEYSIKIKNDSYQRRMFVVSVDGINVVNGKPAGSTPFGYVLNGYSSYEVAGFRTSNDEVHPFKFNDKQKSYAAKSEETGGDISNCGVIGVQVYEEKEKPKPVVQHVHHYHTIKEKEYIPYNPPPWKQPIIWGDVVRTSDSSGDYTPSYTVTSNSLGNMDMTRSLMGRSSVRGMSCGAGGQSAQNINFLSYAAPAASNNDGTTVCDWAEPEETFKAGTEFSKQAKTDRVTNTTFDTGKLLVTIEIHYAYRDGLVSMGVPITKAVKVPQAFPGNFCKPPKD